MVSAAAANAGAPAWPVADEAGRLPLPWLAEPLGRLLGQPGHALLVVGSAGAGVLALQMTAAQAWLCEQRAPGAPAAAPCGRCASCHLVRVGTHPDLQCLLPEALQLELGAVAAAEAADGGSGKRKPSRQIRIGAVRAVLDWVATTGSRGRAKVVVLHPAEALNPQSANALLKTLEEPPPGVRLVLSCDDPQRLLPTVRSRCQQLRMTPPPADAARAWLAGEGLGDEDAAVLLAACGGRPLDALAMARGGLDAARWSALPGAIAMGRVDALAGWSLPGAVDALQKLCHDAMRLTTGGHPVFYPADAVRPAAGLEPLTVLAGELAQAARADEHPLSEPLQLEALAMRAHAAWKAPRGQAAQRSGRADTLPR